jgi:hypothetical protein
LLITVTAGAMLFYFWRTTGSPFRTPYSVDLKTNDGIPLFPWQQVRPSPPYNHVVLQKFYSGSMLEVYQSARRDPVAFVSFKILFLWAFFLAPVLTLPFLMLAVVLPYGLSFKKVNSNARLLLLVCGATLLAVLLPIYFSPHYAAPATAAVYAIVLLAMRRVRGWEWRGKPTGLFVVRAIPTICVILLLLVVAAPSLHISLPPHLWPSWCTRGLQMSDRAQVQSQLTSYDGKQLAIVRYEPSHAPDIEWVYNRAGIDNSEVVWSRDMGAEKNRELLEYFKDRKVWLVEPDSIPPKVSPYSTSGSEASASGR